MKDWQDGSLRVLVGDCRDRLRELTDLSVDAVVTDPPAGISFTGASWDTFPTRRRPASHAFADGRARPAIAGGQEHDPRIRAAFVTWLSEVMVECRRVLKPGGHALVWAIPRTSHWTATAIEDAGFEVRDIVHHLFAQGFPKSLDVSKAIERTTVSEEAERWRGWGTALKPAAEHWILARRPLAQPNVAANVLEHSTGALNIDGCRIGVGAGGTRQGEPSAARRYADRVGDFSMLAGPRGGAAGGRWPANLALSHAEGCQPVGTRKVRGTNLHGPNVYGSISYHGGGTGADGNADYADPDGTETVEAWECVAGCPVAELDQQSGSLTSSFIAAGTEREGLGYRGGLGSRVRHNTIGDSGGASRFFYVAKPSPRERSAGLPPRERNRHPTVKSLALMRWLCRLVTPPGGVVLDPFMGSGTTGCAAVLEDLGFVGIEQDPGSVRTAIARLVHWSRQPSLRLEEAVRPAPASDEPYVEMLSLFEESA